MKSRLILIAFLAMGSMLNAQQLKWGKINNDDKKIEADKIICSSSKETVALVKRKVGVESYNFGLAKYNRAMDLIDLQPLRVNPFNKDVSLLNITSLEESIYAFTTYQNIDQKKTYLFAHQIDKETLKNVGEPKKISEISFKGHIRYNAGGFATAQSPDSSLFMVYYKLPYDRKENEKIGIHVFNAEMEEQWTSEIEFPCAEGCFLYSDIKVSNDGNVYILGRTAEGIEDMSYLKTQTALYEDGYFEVLGFLDQGQKKVTGAITAEDRKISSLELVLPPSGKLLAVGLYCMEDEFSDVTGVYYGELNLRSLEVFHYEMNPFTYEFMGRYEENNPKALRKDSIKGYEAGIERFNMIEVDARENGDLVLIAERGRNTAVTNQLGIVKYTYSRNNILVSSIKENGKVAFNNLIPKAQSAELKTSVSYGYAAKKKNLYFLYNEGDYADSNKVGIVDDFEGKSKKSWLALVKIDAEGKMTKEVVHKNHGSDMLPLPSLTIQAIGDEMILFGDHKTGFVGGKCKLD